MSTSTTPTTPPALAPLPLPTTAAEAQANARLLATLTRTIQRVLGCTTEQARTAAVAALPALLAALED